jgi:hypothetical protein
MSSRRLPATIALCVWSVLVWTTRIVNIVGDDDLTGAEKLGRTLLALSFTGLALAVGHALYHRTTWRSSIVRSLAVWTIGIWAIRALGILAGGRRVGFVAVHLTLAAVSIALAVLAVQEQDDPAPTSADPS